MARATLRHDGSVSRVRAAELRDELQSMSARCSDRRTYDDEHHEDRSTRGPRRGVSARFVAAGDDAGPPIDSPDPLTLCANGCLAEIRRLWHRQRTLPHFMRPNNGRKYESPTYTALQAQIAALARRHTALTAEVGRA